MNTISSHVPTSSWLDSPTHLDEITAVPHHRSSPPSTGGQWHPPVDGLDAPPAAALFKVEDDSTAKPKDGETKPTETRTRTSHRSRTPPIPRRSWVSGPGRGRRALAWPPVG
jgi:hypothetical protein